MWLVHNKKESTIPLPPVDSSFGLLAGYSYNPKLLAVNRGMALTAGGV